MEKWLDRIRNAVPLERQIDAEPSIAGPVMRQMEFLTDENPLTSLYLTLLHKAIDRDTAPEVHPAFPSIISQLSPDEAMVLYVFATEGRKVIRAGQIRGGELMEENFPTERLTVPGQYKVYLNRLRALNLVQFIPETPLQLKTPGSPPRGRESDLSDFGAWFCKTCVPPDFRTEKAGEAHTE